MSKLLDAAGDIIYTSVQDGICNATFATPARIRQAIAAEKCRKQPRSALITGLERELRRRAKGGKRAGSD